MQKQFMNLTFRSLDSLSRTVLVAQLVMSHVLMKENGSSEQKPPFNQEFDYEMK